MNTALETLLFPAVLLAASFAIGGVIDYFAGRSHSDRGVHNTPWAARDSMSENKKEHYDH